MIALRGLPLLALLFGAAPAQAAMHALVMGFDGYAYKIHLEGSRNDAADIASVLRRHGVADVTVLDQDTTTRAAVEQAWAAMAGRAAPGDTLFVSFSGHGNRSPETGKPKHTPDGFEKGFLLPLYDEEKGPEEQLRDEHLYDLFKAASDRGLRIVFVADACHSGATVRAVRAPSVIPKFQTFETHGRPLPPPPAPTTVVRRPPIAGLTIFSAADESQTIQEFTFEDQRRGALSYVLARGLDGAAAEPDGRLTDGNLARYVVTNVRLRSDNTQIPSAVTPDPDQPIFTGAPPARAGFPAVAPLVLFADRAPPPLSAVTLTQDQPAAVLSWVDGQVLNGHGDAVATVEANALQGAVDARRVLDALARLVGQSGGSLATEVAADGEAASDRYYVQGERVRIRAEKGPLGFLTVVDLTADGTVQLLWPRAGDPLRWPHDEAPSFPVQVTPPFGEDSVVFIESDTPLSDLHGELARLDGKVAPLAFYDALRLWLPQAHFSLGIHSVFTCARLKDDRTCA